MTFQFSWYSNIFQNISIVPPSFQFVFVFKINYSLNIFTLSFVFLYTFRKHSQNNIFSLKISSILNDMYLYVQAYRFKGSRSICVFIWCTYQRYLYVISLSGFCRKRIGEDININLQNKQKVCGKRNNNSPVLSTKDTLKRFLCWLGLGTGLLSVFCGSCLTWRRLYFYSSRRGRGKDKQGCWLSKEFRVYAIFFISWIFLGCVCFQIFQLYEFLKRKKVQLLSSSNQI